MLSAGGSTFFCRSFIYKQLASVFFLVFLDKSKQKKNGAKTDLARSKSLFKTKFVSNPIKTKLYIL